MAAKFGKLVIITDINDHLPLSLKDCIKQNYLVKYDGKIECQIQEKFIEINSGFKVILFTKETNLVKENMQCDMPYLQIINNGIEK